jgi:hypothetical protein
VSWILAVIRKCPCKARLISVKGRACLYCVATVYKHRNYFFKNENNSQKKNRWIVDLPSTIFSESHNDSVKGNSPGVS